MEICNVDGFLAFKQRFFSFPVVTLYCYSTTIWKPIFTFKVPYMIEYGAYVTKHFIFYVI